MLRHMNRCIQYICSKLLVQSCFSQGIIELSTYSWTHILFALCRTVAVVQNL